MHSMEAVGNVSKGVQLMRSVKKGTIRQSAPLMKIRPVKPIGRNILSAERISLAADSARQMCRARADARFRALPGPIPIKGQEE